MKLLIFLLTIMGLLSCVASSPIDSKALSTLEQREADPYKLSEDSVVTLDARATEPMDLAISMDLLKRQAGLHWGPVYIGNLKLYLTNPHVGYAGSVNLHRT